MYTHPQRWSAREKERARAGSPRGGESPVARARARTDDRTAARSRRRRWRVGARSLGDGGVRALVWWG